MVFILLVKSRSRDSLLLILASIQGAIVAEIVIKCKKSEDKFNKKYDGDNHLLVH